MVQHARRFTTENGELPYLLHLPAGDAHDAARWPLILFLHGRGERGADPDLVKTQGLPRYIEDKPQFPFIVISPQCPLDGTDWEDHLDTLLGLLDTAQACYPVDVQRVYLTGLSMGGRGVWALGMAAPNRFAALAPICGKRNQHSERICALRDTPVWVFHGDSDTVVPVSESYYMAEALRACGGQVRLTIYPGMGHDSWTATYNNPILYDWLLSPGL